MEQFIWSLALSTHIGLEGAYNEIHPHVRFFEDGGIAGAYYNSMNRISVYGGYRIEPVEGLGIELALTTGYKEFGPIAPHLRTTYNVTDNVRTFASTAFEADGDEVNTGLVAGVEFILKK